jgi:hypothetical protein
MTRRTTSRAPRLGQAPLLPRARARALPAQRAGHRVSSAHVQAAYPFVAEGGLGSRGVYVGRDLHGGSFVYDPWELYGRELTDPNMVVVGHVGSAKSSLIKSLIFRQRVFGRTAHVIDVKREYTAWLTPSAAPSSSYDPTARSGSTRSPRWPAHSANSTCCARSPPPPCTGA